MDINTLIKKRYSVRNYKSKEVEKEKLLKILEAGQYAPSAVNFQPWHFIVVTDKDIHKEASAIYHREWFNDAPVYIFVCGDHSISWKRKEDGKDHCDIDAAIAIDHMTLQAAELGLGTCWICNFNVQMCKDFFQLPEHIEPIAILSLGYPDKVQEIEKKRKPLSEIVHWQSYQKKDQEK